MKRILFLSVREELDDDVTELDLNGMGCTSHSLVMIPFNLIYIYRKQHTQKGPQGMNSVVFFNIFTKMSHRF